MGYELVTPPGELFTLPEVKNHLGVTHTMHDDRLRRLLKTATQRLDGPHGVTGVAMLTQTWRVTARSLWPTEYGQGFRIDHIFPVQSVESISFRVHGTNTTWATSNVQKATDQAGRTVIFPVTGLWWPMADMAWDTWRVEVKAGFGDNPEDVPEPLREAVLVCLEELYFGTVQPSGSPALPARARGLIASFRRSML